LGPRTRYFPSFIPVSVLRHLHRSLSLERVYASLMVYSPQSELPRLSAFSLRTLRFDLSCFSYFWNPTVVDCFRISPEVLTRFFLARFLTCSFVLAHSLTSTNTMASFFQTWFLKITTMTALDSFSSVLDDFDRPLPNTLFFLDHSSTFDSSPPLMTRFPEWVPANSFGSLSYRPFPVSPLIPPCC